MSTSNFISSFKTHIPIIAKLEGVVMAIGDNLGIHAVTVARHSVDTNSICFVVITQHYCVSVVF